MPKEYEAIRDSCISQGKMSEQRCKGMAAATYNKRHPGHPMRGHRRRKRKHQMPKKDSRGYY